MTVPSDASNDLLRSGEQSIAIVHEWIDAYAGSEQVFEALARNFPEADLYALSRDPDVRLDTGGRPIKTTLLDRSALRRRRGLTLPLMPLAWRQLGRADYDVVISSHHAFAQTNRLAADNGRHFSYVYTPARYVWSPEIDERGDAWYLGPAREILKTVDRRSVARLTGCAGISTAVVERIQKYWDIDASVIHPPVRVEYFSESAVETPKRDYILGVGRWIPYKNLHLVVEAGNIAGMPVKIAGRGPDKSRILAAADAASVPVELIESPSDAQLRDLYRNAACLIFPTTEDFGIVPVEAQAAGTPVIAPAIGGALDTVIDGQSGILISSHSPADIAAAIPEATKMSAKACVLSANRFALNIFQERINSWIA